MMPELKESVIHGLGLYRVHPAATHGVVKHPVAILPWPIVLFICDVVQHCSVSILTFERPAHDRPEIAWKRRSVGNRARRRHPDLAFRISVTQFSYQDHVPAI